MTTDELYEFLASPRYNAITDALSVVLICSVIAMVIFAITQFGRAREAQKEPFDGPPWTLLIATFRDTFLITVLYTADTFVFRARDLQVADLSPRSGLLMYWPMVDQFGGVVIYFFILIIAVLRVLALSSWLKSRH